LGGNEGNMVGNDADEHGCIGSAGYTWCEAKNKCVRLWEEDCSSYTKQAVTKILADKYNKELSEVTVTVTKFDDTHAAGGVKFGAGGTGEGGLFLAARVDNVWEVVYDGNGAVDCDKMRNDYGFSDELLKNFCDPLGAKTKP